MTGLPGRRQHKGQRTLREQSSDVAIEVKNLAKHFRLPIDKSNELKQTVINFFQGVKGYKELKVLKDISFTVNKGDFFGIVGRNGSGKSTLLKILSGIYQPEGGSITINGSLAPFLELGVGFNPELSGRENVYLNGALLGFSDKEMDKMYPEIVEFAELKDFMGQKLKNYSSGMQVRLAFSIAIQAKTDILILDEVLAVGDASFQEKCYKYFDDAKLTGKTIILVTHSMAVVKKYCNRVILIDKGQVVSEGYADEVADDYLELFRHKAKHPGVSEGKAALAVEKVKVENLTDKMVEISVKIANNTKQAMTGFGVFLDIYRDGKLVGGNGIGVRGNQRHLSIEPKEKQQFSFALKNIFNRGKYSVVVNIKDMVGKLGFYDYRKDIVSFEIKQNALQDGGYFAAILPGKINKVIAAKTTRTAEARHKKDQSNGQKIAR